MIAYALCDSKTKTERPTDRRVVYNVTGYLVSLRETNKASSGFAK